jgi:ectoine hydroxylase-related dioxygenase (phytanoyl-CoA dioxygenase family)
MAGIAKDSRMSHSGIDRDLSSAPAHPGLKRLKFGSSVDDLKEILDQDGGLILTEVLTREEVDAVNADLEPELSKLAPGNFGSEVSAITMRSKVDEASYSGSRTKHLQHCYKRSRTYREKVLANHMLAQYLSTLLPTRCGTHSLYASVVIEIFPGEKAQGLHRDGETIFGPLGLNNASSVCYLVNCLLALSDVTEEMGATRFIPGSHRWGDYSNFGSQAETIPAVMKAGDMLFYNGKVLHGGGENRTTDRPRRVLASAFSFPFVMGEEAWPFTISAEEVQTYPKQVQALIGFRSKSHHGEDPGLFWRVDTLPLERHLANDADRRKQS